MSRRLWWRFFGQGSGKKTKALVERFIGDLMREHFDRVVTKYAQVRQLCGLRPASKALPTPGSWTSMPMQSQSRRCAATCGEHLAVAKADLEQPWRGAPEHDVKIDGCGE